MKNVLKGIWSFVESIIVIFVIFITSCILCRNDYGYTQFGNYTFVTINEQNVKFFKDYNDGDLLIIRGQKFNINPGDVIYYYLSYDKKYLVKQDVVTSKTEDDYSALYYLNDESNSSVASNRVIGKYVSVQKGMGRVLEVLESRIGFLFLVLLPILIVFIYQVYQLVVVTKYEVVEDDEDIDDSKGNIKKKEKISEKKESKDETDSDSDSDNDNDIELL